MASTFNPAVSGRRNWISASATFAIAVFVGALATMAVVLAVCWLLASSVGLAAAVASASALLGLGVARDLGLTAPLPYRRGQVPEWLRDVLPPVPLAAAFGFMLGAGFLTLFTFSVHLAFVVALPWLSLSSALMAVTVFALGKTVVVISTAGVDQIASVHSRLTLTRAGYRTLQLAMAFVSLAVLAAVTLEL